MRWIWSYANVKLDLGKLNVITSVEIFKKRQKSWNRFKLDRNEWKEVV